MDRIKPEIGMKSVSGEPIQSGDTVITPVSKVFTVRAPYIDFIWNRPVEIQIQKGDESSTIPIVNVNRLAQMAIFGFGASLMLILWLFSKRPVR
ncbi:MAG TPA: hypothetical protein VFI27_13410 [candidate division Zixibacteria bacterium]|nr:hypothetical protein [candidate division Zixibacteria bacterium]